MIHRTPINIFEYRVGDAPEGCWRTVYDRYPDGKPVPEASDDHGRAAFAAHRTPAPGTVPIYRHRHAYDEVFGMKENEKTPVCYALSDRPPASGDGARVCWAFPSSSGADSAGAVAVYEHRLEVWVGYTSNVNGVNVFANRRSVYIKYGTDEHGGRVFDGSAAGRDLAEPSSTWMMGPSRLRADYTRTIAFYAFRAY